MTVTTIPVMRLNGAAPTCRRALPLEVVDPAMLFSSSSDVPAIVSHSLTVCETEPPSLICLAPPMVEGRIAVMFAHSPVLVSVDDPSLRQAKLAGNWYVCS